MMITNAPAWATPVSGLASWLFAHMEQAGTLGVGAPVAQALEAARTESALIPAFAETAETPIQTLWRLHHIEVTKRLPARSILPDMARPWSDASQSVPEPQRVLLYLDGLSTVLFLGAQIFSTKPDALPWKQVHEVEKKLEQAQSVSGRNHHIRALRGVTSEVARLGFTARATSLYREEIRMTGSIPYRDDQLSHLLKLSAGVSTAGLGEHAFSLFRNLIGLAKAYAETSGAYIQLANHIARAGLGAKAAYLFGLMLHELKKNPDGVVRSRAVLGIAMAVTQAGTGDKEKELLAEATRIAEAIESEEIRRQTLADLSALAF